MEESVSHVDQRVLVHRGVPDPVRPAVIVQWDVVHIALVVRHGWSLFSILIRRKPSCEVKQTAKCADPDEQASYTTSAHADDDPASPNLD